MIRALLALSMLASTVYAEPPSRLDTKTRGFKLVPRVTAPRLAPVASSSLIYLHRCPPGGCLVHAGVIDDSRTDISSIADPGDHTLSAFKESDAVWQAVVQCVKDTYAPFNIQITDVDPGNVPHFEEMVGGTPGQLLSGFDNAGGIAPFDCDTIDNGISFTFDVWGDHADQLCWTVAQETAHTFGLEHEYEQKDPMTYIQGDLPKRFQWLDAPCGTGAPAACLCPRSTQNSYKTLVELFGVGAPTPPDVMIKTPNDGAKVTPAFRVLAAAADDAAIDHVELWIDGAMADTTTAFPFVFHAPALDLGDHALEVRAIDVTGMPGSQTIAVTQAPPCTGAAGCSGTDVCVSGSCVAGPGAPGGLGDTCQGNQQCLTLICVAGGDSSLMYCVSECDPSSPVACPSDFDCLPAGSTNVCYPGGGCCSAGGDPRGSAVLACVVVGLVIGRRRRR